jgi:sulfite exporter TauE/SafE
MNKLFFSFFLLGLSLGFGPCLATCGPLLISYTAGTHKSIPKSILTYIIFSLSRVSVYAVLGVLVFLFGQAVSNYFFSSFSRYIFILGGIFIIIIGILMSIGKSPEHKFCQKMQALLLKKDTKTVFIFGLIIGIIPCLPFISALSYIGLASKTWFNSLLLSLSFGLGTVISPLFVVTILAGIIPDVLKDGSKIRTIFNSVCGLIIVFLGLRLLQKAF